MPFSLPLSSSLRKLPNNHVNNTPVKNIRTEAQEYYREKNIWIKYARFFYSLNLPRHFLLAKSDDLVVKRLKEKQGNFPLQPEVNLVPRINVLSGGGGGTINLDARPHGKYVTKMAASNAKRSMSTVLRKNGGL